MEKEKILAQVAKIGIGFAVSALIGYTIKTQHKVAEVIDERWIKPQPTKD